MTTTHVDIIGPNLPDQSKGQFHVHAAGCRDATRLRNQMGPHAGWVIEARSIQDVCEAVYGDIMAENEPGDGWDTWEPYESEFHFAPCVDLPRVAA